ncbi:hypothetical protein SDC9_210070 [bioreactor metagenome]|uniref:Uncharacterized protein n=1 Tax=bioreactor metagenome TaxID=1076179 RepID=A0A645JSH2_9ZZZZ
MQIDLAEVEKRRSINKSRGRNPREKSEDERMIRHETQIFRGHGTDERTG